MIEQPAPSEGFQKTCSDSLLSFCSQSLLDTLSPLRVLGGNVGRKVIRLLYATELTVFLGGGIGWSGEVRIRFDDCKSFAHEISSPVSTGGV